MGKIANKEKRAPCRGTKDSVENPQLSLGLGLPATLSQHFGQLQCALKGECGLFFPVCELRAFSLGMEKETGFL